MIQMIERRKKMKDLVKVNVTSSAYGLKLDDLVTMGIRSNNEKRNFLFISKLLGKHLIVHPDVVQVAGCLLAGLIHRSPWDIKKLVRFLRKQDVDISEDLNRMTICEKSSLVIGFSETATGLGHAVANAITNTTFGITTRQDIAEADGMAVKDTFSFEESHSHATTHHCYLGKSWFDVDRIILVDDELTTGNTMLHLIEHIQTMTDCKEFIILSLLDFRSAQHRQNFYQFQKDHGVKIRVEALLKGELTVLSEEVFTEEETPLLPEVDDIHDYIEDFDAVDTYDSEGSYQLELADRGLFGINAEESWENIEESAQMFAEFYRDEYEDLQDVFEEHDTPYIPVNKWKKILVVGHGENIYIPSRIAHYLGADFKTTSRSPIYVSDDPDYPIHDKVAFMDGDVKYYFYNAKEIEETYDIVFFLTSSDLPVRLTNNCVQLVFDNLDLEGVTEEDIDFVNMVLDSIPKEE